MSDLFPDVPYAEQIAEVEREIALRDRVYRGQVSAGKMTQDQATRHLNAMRAVLATVRAAERVAGSRRGAA